MFAFFQYIVKSISQITIQHHGTHKLFDRYFGHPQWLPDGTVSTLFFRYFSLFPFSNLSKSLCKVKDLWGADLIPWTVSMKEGSPISVVTCCNIRMQIGSCNNNINCLNQFCKSCKFGGPGKGAAPIYIYIYIYIWSFLQGRFELYINVFWCTMSPLLEVKQVSIASCWSTRPWSQNRLVVVWSWRLLIAARIRSIWRYPQGGCICDLNGFSTYI